MTKVIIKVQLNKEPTDYLLIAIYYCITSHSPAHMCVRHCRRYADPGGGYSVISTLLPSGSATTLS